MSEKGKELVKRKTATKMTTPLRLALGRSSITQQIYHQLETKTKASFVRNDIRGRKGEEASFLGVKKPEIYVSKRLHFMIT